MYMADEADDKPAPKGGWVEHYHSPTVKERFNSLKEKFGKLQDKWETKRQERAVKDEETLNRKIKESSSRHTQLAKKQRLHNLEKRNQKISDKLYGSSSSSSGLSGGSIFGDSLFPQQRSKGSDMFGGGSLFGSDMFNAPSLFGGEKERRRKRYYRHKPKKRK